jgi:hypothetical protein
MLKKQKIIIIIFVALFVVLTTLYFAIIAPLTKDDGKETTEPVETDVGEGRTPQNYWLIFPQVERENIESIEVHNKYGTYKFYRNEEDRFVIEGFENLAYDQEQFAQLVVSTGFTISQVKITENPTEEQLREYGFYDDPAYYILTTRSGTVHKVIIGYKIIAGGGYYAMYEGRKTVYVLEKSLEKVVLAPVVDMVAPLVTAGVKTNEYYNIDNFKIYHHDKLFFAAQNLTSEELKERETTALVAAKVTHPGDYTPSNIYDETRLGLAYYAGEAVVALGLTEENLEKYGLSDPPYTIMYDYKDHTYKLIVSEPVDGYYYVGTYLFNTIVKVPEEDFKFLSWSLFKWVDNYVFQKTITFVDSIKVETPQFTELFRLTHLNKSDDPNLIIKGDLCGVIDGSDEVYNFRQFYKSLLNVLIEDDAPLTDEEKAELIADDKNCMLKFTVTTLGGNVTEYGFYRYSTRRCLLTVNGVGQFYVVVDVPRKIAGCAQKVINGETIDPQEKY